LNTLLSLVVVVAALVKAHLLAAVVALVGF
jgi:hypothetical protein